MATSVSKFWFEVDEGISTGGNPVIVDRVSTGKTLSVTQDKVLFDPTRSRFIVPDNTNITQREIVIAVSSPPSLSY